MASATAQRKANRKPAKRLPGLVPATPIPLATDEFRTFLMKGAKKEEITHLTTSVTWSDTAPILTGDLQVQDPDASEKTVKIALGDRVLLLGRARASGTWNEVWRMRIEGASVALKAGTRGWSLADDLQNLADSTDDFRFVRGKAHKRGFLASEIVRAVCRRYGIRIGALPRTTYRIKRHVAKDASPIDVITDVMRTERVHTGKRYVMRFRRGKLYITPLVRSALMYEMGPTIIEGTYAIAKATGYATSLTVHGTSSQAKSKDGKKHAVRKARKVTVHVTSPSAVRRSGVVHKTVSLKGIDSKSEARHKGLAEIVKRLKPGQTLTFTHPGILGVRRGQALRLRDRAHALLQVVWVTEVRHSVSPGEYSIEVTVTFDDPFKLSAADKAAIARAKKAAAKGRKAAGSNKKTVKPKPPKAKLRA